MSNQQKIESLMDIKRRLKDIDCLSEYLENAINKAIQVLRANL